MGMAEEEKKKKKRERRKKERQTITIYFLFFCKTTTYHTVCARIPSSSSSSSFEIVRCYFIWVAITIDFMIINNINIIIIVARSLSSMYRREEKKDSL